MTALPVGRRFGSGRRRKGNKSVTPRRPSQIRRTETDFRAFQAAMPDAPILILLAAPPPSPGGSRSAAAPAGGLEILGLSLVQRAALAARRAGFGEVLLVGGPASTIAGGGLTSPAGPTSPLACRQGGPRRWSLRLRRSWRKRIGSRGLRNDAAPPAAWAAATHRIVMLAAAKAPPCAARARRMGGDRPPRGRGRVGPAFRAG